MERRELLIFTLEFVELGAAKHHTRDTEKTTEQIQFKMVTNINVVP